MDHPAKTKKTGKARIPDHLRRRALVSCDRCKKRRIRCSRSSGSDANQPCQSCAEVGVNCESTLPRKTRIYGSVETLSVRYRVLDALIKGLYPDRDTNDIDTLYAIAEAHDIQLPTFDEQTVAEEVFNQPPKHNAPSPQQSTGSVGSPSTGSRESENPELKGKIVEEKLVPMPQGPSHYIGPSSSFGFVLTVRNMVAEFNAALRTIQPDDERTKLSADFAGSNWSKALEPIVKDESDESSEDNTDRYSGGPYSRVPRQRPPSLFPSSVDSNALTSRLKRVTVLSLLPGKAVTDTFVNAYFEAVHPNYLLFHRPTFQSRYENMWTQSYVLLRDIEPGWICCIFMMIVFGAQNLEDRDPRQSMQIQRHYLNLVQSRMHSLISASTLINTQAILLLQLYQHNCTERNSAFMLLGCASRMAMALGMHREGTSGGFDDMEREVRKRVWWTAYMFEQNQCAILGRPCAIDDSEVNVTFPDEVMLDGGSSVPPGYVDYSVRLMKLLSDVRRKIYSSPSSATQQGESPKMSVAVQFLLDLESWNHSLPATLRLENQNLTPKHRRAVILMHIQFHQIQSLITRPFILRKVGVQLARKLGRHVRSHDLDTEELNLSHACGTYSRKATVLLHQLLITGQFDGVAWIDAYYIYHSVFILALDFLARPWDERDTAEDNERKKAVRDVMNSLQSVKLCRTFTVLTQVALQLAKIVGIFDARSDEIEKSEEYRQYIDQQQAAFGFNYGPPHTNPSHAQNASTNNSNGNGNEAQIGNHNESVAHNWFQKEPVDLPWDLGNMFGTEGYVPAVPVVSGSYGANMPSLGGAYMGLGMAMGAGGGGIMGEEEDGFVPVGGVPEHTAYTHWGNVDAPFATNGMGGVPKGSGFQ
ncbi:related to transcription factor, SIN3 binding [Rhynchosporium agropyri]|uniref:Related to transcription factor, SIN3 binding n=1 Tax=Rhynchosporium agropyri TaxID=914238 RepID=A0A1E1LMY1_9HELO|nr:related to transcription factor, SIN3 binding [Rhynchosporium agropyri]